ncbi:lysozyme inhibitor LprI family protein [Pseudomonas sp. TH08]|uniref:lysozyme inhibitor LprI family protein n=1 Tax=Pseudomonas sp. TH08 TaxID=2796374 RepID=UPI001F5B17B8|nr:lysozyme inhibitor LprI family protein [Pseudomonas sp. TH08]
MNRLVRFIALSFGLLFASTAFAENNCKVITVSWQYLECIEAEGKAADAKLNASYKKLMARFASERAEDPAEAEAFMAIAKDSQRAWLKLRDTTCLLEATDIDPDAVMHSTLINSCIARMSLERAVYLDGIVADGSGMWLI